MYLFSAHNFGLDNQSEGISSEKNNDVFVFPIETTKNVSLQKHWDPL